ncbi:MAG: VWA domain-containing protein [Acidobacteriota bacterium]
MFLSKGLVLTTAVTAFLLGQSPSDQTEDPNFTLHASSQLVVLTVGVQDSRGMNIKGLTPQDFKIYEDGRPQTIKQFAADERPVTVGIVLDASGSMRTNQREVITAALDFVNASNPDDESFVVTFNDRAELGLPSDTQFSGDAEQLRNALYGRVPEGKTALYDALALAAEHLVKGKWENKVLLLISDGGDNNSTHTFNESVRALEMAGAAVYSIGLFDPNEPEHNLGLLRRLSKITGGESFAPMDVSEVGSFCLKIAEDIRASYILAYTPPQPDQHSASRKIKVVATSPAGGRLTIHARTTYILPER